MSSRHAISAPLRIRKVMRSPSLAARSLGARSAVWEVADIPGLWLRRLCIPQQSRSGWQVFSVWDGEDPEDSPTGGEDQKLCALLREQQFATRRQALQAIAAARELPPPPSAVVPF